MAEPVGPTLPADIQTLALGQFGRHCVPGEIDERGVDRAPDNREATIRFRRVALSGALSYSVQREHHNIALDITRMIGGIVLRTVDDAFEYCGLGRVV